MVHRQAVEAAAHVGVPAWGGRSGQGGQEEHAVTARWRFVGQVEDVRLGDVEDGGGEPQGAAAGDESGVLDEVRAGDRVPVGLDEPVLVEDQFMGRCGDGLGRARDVRDDARRDHPGGQ